MKKTPNKLFLVFRWLATRLFVFYGVMAGIFLLTVNYSQLQSHLQGQILNRLMPSFDYFVNFSFGKAEYDPRRLEEFERYFKKVTVVYPQMPEPYTLWGYVDLREGKTSAAVEVLEKGLKKNSYFFWTRYNLALAYFLQKRYQSAVEMAKQAIDLDPQRSLAEIERAHIYRPILAELGKNSGDVLAGNLKKGYQDMHRVLVAAYYASGDKDRAMEAAFFGLRSGWDTDGFFSYYAGRIMFDNGQFLQALIFLQEAAKRRDDDADLLQCLADTLTRLNNVIESEKFAHAAQNLRQQKRHRSYLSLLVPRAF